MKTLKMENVLTQELKPDPRNARKHDRENIEAIKASLERFGQQKPIVVSQDNIVIAGNGTLQAALELGWKSLAVVRSDLKDWTGFALADNRTSDLSRWDDNVLAALLSELTYSPEEIGFDEGFIEALAISPHSSLDDPFEESSPVEHKPLEVQAYVPNYAPTYSAPVAPVPSSPVPLSSPAASSVPASPSVSPSASLHVPTPPASTPSPSVPVASLQQEIEKKASSKKSFVSMVCPFCEAEYHVDKGDLQKEIEKEG